MQKFSEAPVKGEGTQFNENQFVADLEPEHGHNVNYLFTLQIPLEHQEKPALTAKEIDLCHLLYM
jgi:hypothetical protein